MKAIIMKSKWLQVCVKVDLRRKVERCGCVLATEEVEREEEGDEVEKKVEKGEEKVEEEV